MDTVSTTQRTYVCKGTCGGSVTEEEYNAGKNVCGMEGCTMHGQPLVEKVETVTHTDDTEDVIINNG